MKPYELFGDGGYQEGIRAQRRLDIERRRELREERQAYIQEIISLKEQRRNTRDRDEKAVLTQQINEVQSYINQLNEAINELTNEIDAASGW